MSEKIKFIKTSQSNLPAQGLLGGIYFCIDTRNLYMTNSDSTLSKYSDIIELDTEDERLGLFAPLTDKFYYVKSSKRMYFYKDSFELLGGYLLESNFIATLDNTTNIIHGLNYNPLYDILQAFDMYVGGLLTITENYTENINNNSIDLVEMSLKVGEKIKFNLFKNMKV